MILFNPQARINFPQYGISIPSLPTRAQKTVDALLAKKSFKDTQKKWLLSEIPYEIEKSDLMRAHNKDYVDALYDKRLEEKLLAAYELLDDQGNFNRYDPDSAQKPLVEIIKDITRIIDGTYQSIRIALKEDFCYNLGGGMHHAHPGFGHGFCLLNDISTALLKAQSEGLFSSAWIIDVDAHRGDGTAEIMAGHSDITALSIHMASGWPLDSPQVREDGSLNPAWFPGDVDIPVEAGEENEYIPRLMKALENLEAEKGLPDLFFVVGGVDPYEKDELPSTDPINLTRDQMLKRDQSLYQYFQKKGRPSAWVAAGGYGRYSWEIHADFLSWVLKERGF
jgi:acetoin utilization deacetylase AcuC-like enzyme